MMAVFYLLLIILWAIFPFLGIWGLKLKIEDLEVRIKKLEDGDER